MKETIILTAVLGSLMGGLCGMGWYIGCYMPKKFKVCGSVIIFLAILIGSMLEGYALYNNWNEGKCGNCGVEWEYVEDASRVDGGYYQCPECGREFR